MTSFGCCSLSAAVGPALRAVVLIGTGFVFSASVDLAAIGDGGPDYNRELLPALDQVFLDLFALEIPVVAASNGPAAAGGCVLACCADRIVALDTPAMGLPELALGVALPRSVVDAARYTLGPATQNAVHGGQMPGVIASGWCRPAGACPTCRTE